MSVPRGAGLKSFICILMSFLNLMMKEERDGVSNEPGKKVRGMGGLETNITMEIAQLLLSLLHAWGMDPDLDRVCESKLGLLRPMVPVSFGVLSKGG
uniref:Uncharacterized protein n=1 Tax=Timema bartmani TaxID=61472 RepID=A0A7R9HW27_9NEOP|nr:unnamed protein product [Timema bartmani]